MIEIILINGKIYLDREVEEEYGRCKSSKSLRSGLKKY